MLETNFNLYYFIYFYSRCACHHLHHRRRRPWLTLWQLRMAIAADALRKVWNSIKVQYPSSIFLSMDYNEVSTVVGDDEDASSSPQTQRLLGLSYCLPLSYEPSYAMVGRVFCPYGAGGRDGCGPRSKKGQVHNSSRACCEHGFVLLCIASLVQTQSGDQEEQEQSFPEPSHFLSKTE